MHGATDYVMEEIEMTGTTETVREYIYGRNGIIAFRTASVNHFVIKDHLGSTRVVFNGTTGIIEDYYDYEVFGETARSRETANLTQYRFTGQEWDEETNYYNFKARLYSPKLGRFSTVDPAGQTFGLYNYAGNNPILYVDPDGEFFWIPALIVGSMFLGHDLAKNDFKMNIGQMLGSFGSGFLAGGFGSASGAFDAVLSGASSIASSYLPSVGTTLPGGISFSANPFASFGTTGVSGGIGMNFSKKVGDVTVGGGIAGGFSNQPGNQKSGAFSQATRSASIKGSSGVGFGFSMTTNKMNRNVNSPYNQSYWQATLSIGDFHLSELNDLPNTDKGLTQQLEIGIGNFSIGSYILTNDAGDRTVEGNTRDAISEDTNMPLDNKTYTNGEVYSSPLYISIKSKGKTYKIGYDHPVIQDQQQNRVHYYLTKKLFGEKSPYFAKGNYSRAFFEVETQR